MAPLAQFAVALSVSTDQLRFETQIFPLKLTCFNFIGCLNLDENALNWLANNSYLCHNLNMCVNYWLKCYLWEKFWNNNLILCLI